jgi:hypothetical protein
MAGGPTGLAAIGGVAAVAAAEYLGARRTGAGALEEIGRPSEIALQAVERINDGSLAPTAEVEDETEAAPVPDGRSIWDDLPPVARQWEPLEGNGQHEEDGTDGR